METTVSSSTIFESMESLISIVFYFYEVYLIPVENSDMILSPDEITIITWYISAKLGPVPRTVVVNVRINMHGFISFYKSDFNFKLMERRQFWNEVTIH